MPGKPGGVVDVELVHQLLPVLFDGFDAYAEFGRDLFVGRTLRDELQHLRFARGQRLLGFRAGVAAFACFPRTATTNMLPTWPKSAPPDTW